MEQSLIQQRLAIRRERVLGLVRMSFGGLGLLIAVPLIAYDISRWPPWVMAVAWAAFTVIGIREYLVYRRRLRAFDAEHGPDAGRQ